jgi:UDP-N-acetylmuramoyl-tripeptide--D-alanyl-D-alanine ligase
MGLLTVKDILEATGGELLSENSMIFKGVSTDSRTIGDGELFFAIRGDRFDGHDYLEKALMKGSGAVVDARPESLPKDRVVVCVHDTLKSLQDLAHFIRMKKDIPVIAVTGSNGKTTTKEMIHRILSRKFKVLKNEGNLNNHIGLPLSLMRLVPDDDAIVLEMGMNAAGEIRRLCEIAAPSHGVITNIGSAHMGMLGSYEAVRDAKLEIMEGLRVAIVNADDSFLMEGIEQIEDFDGQIISYAINSDSPVMARDVRPTETGSEFILEIKDVDRVPVNLKVLGLFNVYNALAAAAAGYSLGISPDEIKKALDAFGAFPMRFEVIRKGSIRIINDSYNANPSSIRESVKELIHFRKEGRIVAVLGDMLELGEFSEGEHRDVGKMISRAGVDVFIAVGEEMALAADECKKDAAENGWPEVFVFSDAVETGNNIMNILQQGDTVLIKGSRSMTMERIVGGVSDAV